MPAVSSIPNCHTEHINISVHVYIVCMPPHVTWHVQPQSFKSKGIGLGHGEVSEIQELNDLELGSEFSGFENINKQAFLNWFNRSIWLFSHSKWIVLGTPYGCMDGISVKWQRHVFSLILSKYLHWMQVEPVFTRKMYLVQSLMYFILDCTAGYTPWKTEAYKFVS